MLRRTRCPFPRKTPIVPSALTPTIRYSQADPESGAGDFVGNDTFSFRASDVLGAQAEGHRLVVLTA